MIFRGQPLLVALMLPTLATAACGGAWTTQAAGGVMSSGKQVLVGRPLSAPPGTPHAAAVTRLVWKITLLSPPPPGLTIKLCYHDGCFPLTALAGQRLADRYLSPDNNFRFIYFVNRRGQLRPPLNVVSNRLTVNYR